MGVLHELFLLIFPFLIFLVFFLKIIRRKWCSKCKRVSMVKAGSDRVNRKRMLVCSKCNHSKTYDFDNHNNPFLNSPD